MVALGQRVSEQLSRLGIPAEAMGVQLGQLSSARLERLSGRLDIALRHVGPAALALNNKFGRNVEDARWNIAPPLHNPMPSEAMADRRRFIAPSYYQPQAQLHPSQNQLLEALLDRFTQRGAVFSRALNSDAALKQSFENKSQLMVVTDQRGDGAVSVAPMTAGSGGGGGGALGIGYDLFMQMDQAVMREATKISHVTTAGAELYGDPSYGGVGSVPTGAYPGPAGGPAGGVWGMGSGGEGYFSGGGQGGFFGSGSFSGSSTGGATGGTNGVANPAAPGESQGGPGSTDQQVLNLKRMMDKRNQMYDLWKSVMDKHNESAKTAINNLRA